MRKRDRGQAQHRARPPSAAAAASAPTRTFGGAPTPNVATRSTAVSAAAEDEVVTGFGDMVQDEFSSTDYDTLSEDDADAADGYLNIAVEETTAAVATAAVARVVPPPSSPSSPATVAPATVAPVAPWLVAPAKAIDNLVSLLPRAMLFRDGGDEGAVAHPVVLTVLSNAFGANLKKGT